MILMMMMMMMMTTTTTTMKMLMIIINAKQIYPANPMRWSIVFHITDH